SDATIGRLGRGVDELVAVHLSIQPYAAAGSVHSLRNDARRAPDRAANRRRNRRGRACFASKPGVRSGETVLRSKRSLHPLIGRVWLVIAGASSCPRERLPGFLRKPAGAVGSSAMALASVPLSRSGAAASAIASASALAKQW